MLISSSTSRFVFPLLCIVTTTSLVMLLFLGISSPLIIHNSHRSIIKHRGGGFLLNFTLTTTEDKPTYLKEWKNWGCLLSSGLQSRSSSFSLGCRDFYLCCLFLSRVVCRVQKQSVWSTPSSFRAQMSKPLNVITLHFLRVSIDDDTTPCVNKSIV